MWSSGATSGKFGGGPALIARTPTDAAGEGWGRGGDPYEQKHLRTHFFNPHGLRYCDLLKDRREHRPMDCGPMLGKVTV